MHVLGYYGAKGNIYGPIYVFIPMVPILVPMSIIAITEYLFTKKGSFEFASLVYSIKAKNGF